MLDFNMFGKGMPESKTPTTSPSPPLPPKENMNVMPSPLPPAATTGPLSPPQAKQSIQPCISKKENLRLSYEHNKTNSVSPYEYEAAKWVYEPRQLPPQKLKLLAPPNTTNIKRTNQHRHPLNSAGMKRTNKQVFSHFCFTENGRQYFPETGFQKQSIEFLVGGPLQTISMCRYNERGVLTNVVSGLKNIRRALTTFISMDVPTPRYLHSETRAVTYYRQR